MRAELLAIGSELLTPLRTDTNGVFLTRKLLELGIEVVARTTVADEPSLLESAFRTALSRTDLVIATEGPRIAPHRAAMRASIAGLLGVEPDAVNVKGKTLEGLGALAGGTGVAVQAVCLLVRSGTRSGT